MVTEPVCDTNDGYVLREGVCCRVTFNCPTGHEIKPCENHHEEEKCVKCSDGFHQPFLVSSYHEERSCYQSKPCTNISPNYITRRIESETFIPAHCQCNTYKCYHDVHHVCNQVASCPVNKTLNRNGECEQCPYLHYKRQTGCGPCKMDVNKWMESLKRNKTKNSAQTTSNFLSTEIPYSGYRVADMTTQANQSSVESATMTDQTGAEIIYPIVGSLAGIILLILILVISVCFCKRRNGLLKMKKKTNFEELELVITNSGHSSNVAPVSQKSNNLPIDSFDHLKESTPNISPNGSVSPVQPSDSMPSDSELAVSGSSFQIPNNPERQISVESTRSYRDKINGLKSSPGSTRCPPVASISPFSDSGKVSANTTSIPSYTGDYVVSITNHTNHGTLSHNTEVKRSSFLSSHAVKNDNTEEIVTTL